MCGLRLQRTRYAYTGRQSLGLSSARPRWYLLIQSSVEILEELLSRGKEGSSLVEILRIWVAVFCEHKDEGTTVT